MKIIFLFCATLISFIAHSDVFECKTICEYGKTSNISVDNDFARSPELAIDILQKKSIQYAVPLAWGADAKLIAAHQKT